MRTLVIDTSGVACSLALFDDDALIAERHEDIGRGHAERIIPWIAELPEGGRADHIIVGCGPGSFTGVRVGIAAARALALGWNVPVSGVSSLALIAADAATDGALLVATEGGHGELFVQAFDGPRLHESGALQALTPEDAAKAFAQSNIAGNGAERVVSARGTGNAISAAPRASALRLLPPEMAALPPSPIYGRAPDAKPPQS